MKRIFVALLLSLVLSQTLTGLAQETVTALDQLKVDIWPDYDQPSVLVLLTGTLPDDAVLPATISIPIPNNGTINAVAHIEQDGNMISIADFDDSVPDQLTLTTSEPQFRIEYYFPYAADGNDRSFLFTWRSDLTVDEFVVSVQQPILAEEMTISPSARSVTTGGDGMQYHDLPATSVAAREVYELDGSYTLTRPQLSVELLSAEEVPLFGAGDTDEQGNGFDWLLAGGIALGVTLALLIIVAIVWLITSNRSSRRRVVKPTPVRQKKPPVSSKPDTLDERRFCHECGQPVDASDRFCRNCGATVKGAT